MNDLDQSSQSNAASAEQIASTSTEIQGQATQVEQEVALLNAIVLGNRKASFQSAA
jgi:methyl-accepting chemotaxis protein